MHYDFLKLNDVEETTIVSDSTYAIVNNTGSSTTNKISIDKLKIDPTIVINKIEIGQSNGIVGLNKDSKINKEYIPIQDSCYIVAYDRQLNQCNTSQNINIAEDMLTYIIRQGYVSDEPAQQEVLCNIKFYSYDISYIINHHITEIRVFENKIRFEDYDNNLYIFFNLTTRSWYVEPSPGPE